MENLTTAPTTQTSDSEVVLKRKSDDVGWNFCILSDAKNMDKVQCIKCGKKMSGGVYRIKEHIAQIKGNVASCTKASKEDQELCRNAINEAKLKKKMKKCEGEELRSQVNVNKEIDSEQLEESLGSFKPQHSLGPMDKFASAITPEISLSSGKSNLRVQNINDALFKERSEIVKDYVVRWVYEGGISFNSIELDSFKMMMEAVGQFGPSFVPPTRYELSGPLLKKNIERTKDLLKSHEEEWKLHGCSIMTDAWSDRKRRSIMNLCVNSRLGTVFLSSKEFSDVAHTSQVIFEYVDQCIEEVGAENVLQIVTDNASNNMGAAVTPNLQSFAVRILSLTTSSSGCERNWSTFEGVHTKKRNRLGTNLLNNLVFVQFNARLLSNQKRGKNISDVDVIASNDSSHAQAWIVDEIADDDVDDVGEERRIRELHEDDFESEDEVVNENEAIVE